MPLKPPTCGGGGGWGWVNPNESLDSNKSLAFALFESNDTFFYKSDSLLLADSQEQRQRRMQNSTQNLNTRSANQSNNPNANQSNLTNQSNTLNPNKNDKYYLRLSPT